MRRLMSHIPMCGTSRRLDRSFVGIELNADYAEIARRRIEADAPLFNEVEEK